MAKQGGMRDPFASSALPRSFYHPTPSRGVDTNVAITGPERDQESKTSEVDAHFLKGSSTLMPSLTHLNPFPLRRQHDIPMDFNNSNRSGHHFHEVWPESEQPSSTSFHADISPFTSISAEAENNKIPEPHIGEYNRGRYSVHEDLSTNKTPEKSVLQRYIERFRNSEPKSRMDRAKENEANYQDFWWMHSSPSSPADGDSQARKKQSSLVSAPLINTSQAHEPSGRKLTKEAVMELDKETSELQNKADHILTKSQLSLASSGPIVSTQGLGSSTSISEYSIKTDSQAPYRPAFVNIREHSSISDAHEAPLNGNYRQHEVSQNVSSPPGDILAKWRLRRKMEEAKTSLIQKSKPLSMQGVARNREMDLRLEEFRKKLLSQRALITQEEIQYERQKMKMMMEEDSDKISNLKGKELATSERDSQSYGPDPILVRLKSITGTMTTKPPSSLDLSEENAKNLTQNSQSEGSVPHKVTSSSEMLEKSLEMNSNLNNACFDSKSNLTIPGSLNDSALSLNKNNTAISVNGDSSNNGKPHAIDNMTSLVLCDATKKYVTLKEKNDSNENICEKCKSKSNSLSSHGLGEEKKPGHILTDERKVAAKIDGDTLGSIHSDVSHSAKAACEETADSVCEKQVYHQYLEAEKPNVEVVPKALEKTEEDGNGNSSERSDKSVRRRRSRKKEKKIPNVGSDEKGEIANDVHKQDIDNENPQCFESDNSSSSKTSQRQDASSSKISSKKGQNISENQLTTKLHSEDVVTPSKQASHVSHTSFSKDRKLSNSKPASSHSSCQQNIQKAVIQTVADHLFDGPSVISSVDSWASLFPQSPAPSRSFYDSDLASPSPHRGKTTPMQSTPTHLSSLALAETERGSSESDNEFEDDPLLSLLRQQRQDYVKKLEAIESALTKLER